MRFRSFGVRNDDDCISGIKLNYRFFQHILQCISDSRILRKTVRLTEVFDVEKKTIKFDRISNKNVIHGNAACVMEIFRINIATFILFSISAAAVVIVESTQISNENVIINGLDEDLLTAYPKRNEKRIRANIFCVLQNIKEIDVVVFSSSVSMT